jgi:hypothetical protein
MFLDFRRPVLASPLVSKFDFIYLFVLSSTKDVKKLINMSYLLLVCSVLFRFDPPGPGRRRYLQLDIFCVLNII